MLPHKSKECAEEPHRKAKKTTSSAALCSAFSSVWPRRRCVRACAAREKRRRPSSSEMARNLISFVVWLLCEPAYPLVVPTHAHSAVGLQRVAATLCESEPLSRGEATGEYDGDGMTYSSADAVRDMVAASRKRSYAEGREGCCG